MYILVMEALDQVFVVMCKTGQQVLMVDGMMVSNGGRHILQNFWCSPVVCWDLRVRAGKGTNVSQLKQRTGWTYKTHKQMQICFLIPRTNIYAL